MLKPTISYCLGSINFVINSAVEKSRNVEMTIYSYISIFGIPLVKYKKDVCHVKNCKRSNLSSSHFQMKYTAVVLLCGTPGLFRHMIHVCVFFFS